VNARGEYVLSNDIGFNPNGGAWTGVAPVS
jgi:hypothetical protein